MQKLLTGLAASAALAFAFSTAQACDFHEQHVMASAAPEESVVMSTHDQVSLPLIAEQTQPAATIECAPGAKDCVPAKE